MFLAIISAILRWYVIIVVVRILCTWIPHNPWSNFGKFVAVLGRVTDPILMPLRRIIPPLRAGGMAIDLSPMLLIVVLTVIANRL